MGGAKLVICHIKASILLMLSVGAFFQICMPCCCFASDASRQSERIVGAYHAQLSGIEAILASVSARAHIAIGFEEIHAGDHWAQIAFDFPGGTLSDLLNKLVSENPGYGWQEADSGVIHVFSKRGHSSIVDLEIAYPGAHEKTRQEIWNQVFELPEVLLWIQENQCAPFRVFFGNEFTSHNEPITISAGNLTLAELLDQVSIRSGRQFWKVTQWMSDNSCRISIGV